MKEVLIAAFIGAMLTGLVSAFALAAVEGRSVETQPPTESTNIF